MDTAVGLVQTYLRVNGYFTVSEYPIVELREDFQVATDVDLLGFRFPAAERVIPGTGDGSVTRVTRFRVDPRLQVPPGRADMIVAEVKEGAAEFNRSGRRPEVLAAALARFGCCPGDAVDGLVDGLLRTGEALTSHGHAVRMVAFGATAEGRQPYLRVPLGHVTSFLEEWLRKHWNVLRHAQLKDPVLAFLVALEKARIGEALAARGSEGASGAT